MAKYLVREEPVGSRKILPDLFTHPSRDGFGAGIHCCVDIKESMYNICRENSDKMEKKVLPVGGDGSLHIR